MLFPYQQSGIALHGFAAAAQAAAGQHAGAAAAVAVMVKFAQVLILKKNKAGTLAAMYQENPDDGASHEPLF
jgi:hypothetical protein